MHRTRNRGWEAASGDAGNPASPCSELRLMGAEGPWDPEAGGGGGGSGVSELNEPMDIHWRSDDLSGAEKPGLWHQKVGSALMGAPPPNAFTMYLGIC